MIDTVLRLVLLLEIAMLVSAGTYLHLSYRGGLPAQLVVVGRTFATVLLVVALGVLINALTEQPVTHGTRVLAIVAAPLAVRLSFVAHRDVRARRR